MDVEKLVDQMWAKVRPAVVAELRAALGEAQAPAPADDLSEAERERVERAAQRLVGRGAKKGFNPQPV